MAIRAPDGANKPVLLTLSALLTLPTQLQNGYHTFTFNNALQDLEQHVGQYGLVGG